MVEMATHHAMPEEERRQILRNAREIIAKAKGN
jgi:plasmid stability protein